MADECVTPGAHIFVCVVHLINFHFFSRNKYSLYSNLSTGFIKLAFNNVKGCYAATSVTSLPPMSWERFIRSTGKFGWRIRNLNIVVQIRCSAFSRSVFVRNNIPNAYAYEGILTKFSAFILFFPERCDSSTSFTSHRNSNSRSYFKSAARTWNPWSLIFP